jgi:hypothetical protein
MKIIFISLFLLPLPLLNQLSRPPPATGTRHGCPRIREEDTSGPEGDEQKGRGHRTGSDTRHIRVTTTRDPPPRG